MTQRITNEQLAGALSRYVGACYRLEMIPEGGFRLDEGSKTYGNAYRLFAVDTGREAPGTVNGYLGMTKREAYDTLMTMALTLESVLHHTDQL